MCPISNRWRRRVSRPSRPVPTCVPTSSQVGQGCPDRPDLFACARIAVPFPSNQQIQCRSGQLGQLGQINSFKGFDCPDLGDQVGTVGTAGSVRVPRESVRGSGRVPAASSRLGSRCVWVVQVRGSSREWSATGNSDPDNALVTGVFKGGYVDA